MAARAVAVVVALTALLASPPSALASPPSPAELAASADAGAAAPSLVPRAHAHLLRRKRQLSSSSHSPAIVSRQVHDPRSAAARWEKRDEIALARRATPSNTPKICAGTITGYSQCGGQNWAQDTCCVAGYTCVYISEYLSQCLPPASSSASISSTATAFNPSSSTQALAASSTSSAAPSSSSPATSCSKGVSTEYGQCGGSGYSGATCCPSGFVCTFSNDWYSQCLPGVSSTTPSSSQVQQSSTSLAPSTTSTTPAQQSSTSKASSSSSTSATATQSTAPKICAGTITGYSQCGGQNWAQDTCCVAGYSLAVPAAGGRVVLELLLVLDYDTGAADLDEQACVEHDYE
ncbi:hypothetical protein JCM3770_001777, partial [Rhodotorula araucariae]